MIPFEQKSATRSAVPRPATGQIPLQHTRVDQDDWDDLEAAVGRKRAKVVRDLIAWYLRRPGAALPERLTREQMAEIARKRVVGE